MPENPHDQAQLFYLVLLGSVIAVGVFYNYRHRLGQAAQHAAIWGLIFVGLVLAIGFKDNLMTMLKGAPAAQQVSDEALVLRRQKDGHFHALVEINGQEIHFLVDTGATNLVLSQRDARTAGFDTDDLNFIIRTQTANGETMSAPVRIDRVELAQFSDRDVPATVNGGDLDVSLLGMSYLDRFDGFSVEGDRMFLWRE